jgi:hypothetical protein
LLTYSWRREPDAPGMEMHVLMLLLNACGIKTKFGNLATIRW